MDAPGESQNYFKGWTCLAANQSGPSLNDCQKILMYPTSTFFMMCAGAFHFFHLFLHYFRRH